MSPTNTSSVTKHTKEEGGDFSGSHLSEAKGAYKCPLLLAKILLGGGESCILSINLTLLYGGRILEVFVVFVCSFLH